MALFSACQPFSLRFGRLVVAVSDFFVTGSSLVTLVTTIIECPYQLGSLLLA